MIERYAILALGFVLGFACITAMGWIYRSWRRARVRRAVDREIMQEYDRFTQRQAQRRRF